MDEITAYLPGLSPVENKELCVRFDGGRLSSDGGVLVLREIEKRLGLAARLAGCLSDARDPASTTHSYADMIGARMFAIACGYEDCDDLDVLRFDPAFKLACGRLTLLGSRQWSRLSSFPYRSRTRAPSLRRRYPASAVIQAPPPPCWPGLPLTRFRLECAFHRQGFPCCHRPPLPCVPPPLPRRSQSVRASPSSRPMAAFPAIQAGRPPRCPFRGLLSVHSRCGPHGC